MRKVLFIALSVMLAFSSCSSIGNLSDETLPGWIDNPYVRSGRIAYVNEGSGNSEEEAELNAMENLLIELGSDLGIDAYALYFRELSSSGTLNALDGNITDTYFRTYRGGRYSCYVMLDISADLFDQMQSPETRRAMEVRAEIESLMESARADYMENRDIGALSKTLEALSLSIENGVENPGISSDEILSVAMYYLEPLEIRYRQYGSGIDGEITVRRRRGILYPLVYDAELIGTYDIRDTEGNIKEESIRFNTGSAGRYDFHNTNKAISEIGEFALDFSFDRSVIERIASLAEPGYLDSFISLLEEKHRVFSYAENRNSDYGLTVLLAEYDITGQELEDSAGLDSFNAEMMNSGYSIRAGKASGDDDSEILSNAMASGMDLNDSIAVLRIGVADSVETPGRTVLAYVSSTLGIYDRDTSELIFSDNTTSSIGSGESYSEAVMDAFTNCGRNLASTVITYL